MKWSFSQNYTFNKCQRQWFYRYVFASSTAKDPMRNEAKRLSKLTNLKAWRGKIVDAVISNDIIPSIGHGESLDLESAQQIAWKIFQEQQILGTQAKSVKSGDFSGFLEVEYGKPLMPEQFDETWKEIQLALTNFFGNSIVWDALNLAHSRKTQRIIPFSCNEVNLTAIPDVLCFYQNRAPLIIDWKVQSNPIGNYWMQLALYSLALTRCRPHSDWPFLPPKLSPSDIGLAEVQLLTSVVRRHVVAQDEIEELEEMIASSVTDILLVTGGRKPKELRAEEFPSARSPSTCSYCPFKKLCWVI